jgi:AraC family transcriptional regulator
MVEEARTLGFGVTYDMVAAETACGQLLSLTSHRCGEGTPPHKHVNDYICIVLTGGFAEQERNRCLERRCGCYFTHQAGETHHDRFGPDGAICVNLHYDRGEAGPSLEGMCPAPAKVAADRLAFELAGSRHEELVLSSLAAEIMAELRPLDARRRDLGAWIDRVVEAISDQPDRRWTLRELAEVAERHPVHVAQSFRTKTGISIGAFQRLRRLTRLSVELQRGTTPLAMLAADFGYCDQSHMNSEFRARFGVSPGRYRRGFH